MSKAEEQIVKYGNMDMTISIPLNDYGLFKYLANRFGWIFTPLSQKEDISEGFS